MNSMDACSFKLLCKCNKPPGSKLSTGGISRISSIIQASQDRDELPNDLQAAISENENNTLLYHRNYASPYCSKVQRSLNKSSSGKPPPSKKTRRSDSTDFIFETHCIFCGKEYTETKDLKNPNRRRPVRRCRTSNINRRKLFFRCVKYDRINGLRKLNCVYVMR